MNKGFRKFCSRKCMLDSPEIKESREKTNIIKYGVNNPSKNKDIRNKVEQTNIGKFGKRYPMMSNSIVDKVKSNFLEKYGVNNPSKLKKIRDKAKKTMIDRYGVEFAAQNIDIFNRIKKNNLEKWGKEFYTQTEEYKEIIKNQTFQKNKLLIDNLIEINNTEFKIFCNLCSKEFIIQKQLWRNRRRNGEEICLFCNPITTSTSKMEKSILEYIRSNYGGDILENYRYCNKEIDIYLPKLNIGFEYNGIYWHSEMNKSKDYHSEKTNFFYSKGIQIIHIWEDDWVYRKDIVKSIILNKIGISDRIFARKCEIREISDNSLIRNFLNENHIQGFVGSKIKIGLFINNELISLMTFSGLRKSLGSKSEVGSYEMIRFCNKLNTSVVGGASKIFKYFIDIYCPKFVVSYSDTSRGFGNLYKKLGFDFINDTPINYYWCKNGIRYHRFNFRKDKLVKEGFDSNQTEIEIMHSRDYYRVFDCGSKKWKMSFHN